MNSVLPISIVPAGRFKFPACSAIVIAVIGRLYAFNRSGLTSIQITLSRSPAICTCAMFLISDISSFKFSAISRICASEMLPPTAIVNIGNPELISNSITLGSSKIPSGKSLTPSTAVRRFSISLSKSLSLISSKSTEIIDLPSDEVEIIRLILLTFSSIASSIGADISFSTSSGDAPGYSVVTVALCRAISGVSSRGRFIHAYTPKIIIRIISMFAKTGLFTDILGMDMRVKFLLSVDI